MATNPWVGGKSGIGVEFDGTNDYITCGDVLDIVHPAGLTVSVRFCITNSTNTYQAVVAKGTAGRLYSLAPNAGAMNFIWTEGFTGSVSAITLSSSLVVGQWYHLVGVRDVGRQGAIIYLNGVNVYSDAGNSAKAANAEALTFGSGGSGFGYFQGRLDHVMIWSRGLWPSEVRDLYANPFSFIAPAKPRFIPDSVAFGQNTRAGEFLISGF
jgi:hypothetical protein